MTLAPAELSVILVADTFETIRETVRHLTGQTARDRLELVVVTWSAEALGLDAAHCTGLGAVRVVEALGGDGFGDLARMRAVGVEAASAPVVLFGESHSFPDPGAVEALIDAHRGPWAAVGQAMCNGNPGTMASWTCLYLDYGAWVDPCDGGVVDELPTNNTSFKRAPLVECGEELAALLVSSDRINATLRARGSSFYLEPRARTFHVNVSRTSSWLVDRAAFGRAYAGARSESWPAWRRAVYACGSPLIPVVRLRRTLRDIRRTRRMELLPRILPALIVSLVVSASGEALGYALGRGGAARRVGEIEIHRMRYLKRDDRISTAIEDGPS